MSPELELSRRERKKEETKERIFKAALALFKQKGVEQTTVDEISAKADVAKGTFFNYFPHKEAVFGYLGETWFAQAEAESSEILSRPGRVGPQLIAMFAELAAFHEEEPTIARYVVAEWMRNQHTGTDEMCLRWDDLAIRMIGKLQANGELRPDEVPERLAGSGATFPVKRRVAPALDARVRGPGAARRQVTCDGSLQRCCSRDSAGPRWRSSLRTRCT